MVIAPIGFVSDHMEILFDLDTQARELCETLGLQMVRAETAGTHPRFIHMIRELITERMDDSQPRPALGVLGPRPDFCPADCCPMPARPARPSNKTGAEGARIFILRNDWCAGRALLERSSK